MKFIKILRMEVGVKQYVLAEKLGIEQSNYANMENEKLIPNNIDDIKSRALDYLLPLLDEKIKTKRKEIEFLELLKLKLKS